MDLSENVGQHSNSSEDRHMMAMVSIMFGPKIDGSELVARECHGND
jgi:hypothetical protein